MSVCKDYYVPPPRRLCFHPCLSVGLLFYLLAEKLLNQFSPNLVEEQGLGPGSARHISVWMWFKGQIQDFLFPPTFFDFVFMTNKQLENDMWDCLAMVVHTINDIVPWGT